MQGQTKFPAGFGCDPTALSGGAPSFGRVNRRLEPAQPGGSARAALRPDAGGPLPTPVRRTRRLVDIEAQQTLEPRARSVSTLWTSAALGAALASSLYFLNYF